MNSLAFRPARASDFSCASYADVETETEAAAIAPYHATEPGFWIVWNPGGSNPRFRHPTYENAATEARRLALQNPGQGFYVLAAECFCQMHGLTIKRLTRPESEADDGIPF